MLWVVYVEHKLSKSNCFWTFHGTEWGIANWKRLLDSCVCVCFVEQSCSLFVVWSHSSQLSRVFACCLWILHCLSILNSTILVLLAKTVFTWKCSDVINSSLYIKMESPIYVIHILNNNVSEHFNGVFLVEYSARKLTPITYSHEFMHSSW